MIAIKQKDDSKNPIIIVVILINLLFLGNTFFSGWSLLWPTASGMVTDAEPKIFYIVGKYSNYARYSLVLTYTYQYGLTEHVGKVVMDTFNSKDLCNMVADRYRNKPVKVYIDPFNTSLSTIKPGDNFVNSLICNVLIGLLTGFFYLMKPNITKSESEP